MSEQDTNGHTSETLDRDLAADEAALDAATQAARAADAGHGPDDADADADAEGHAPDVTDTPQFKGLMREVQELREERRAMRAELDAIRTRTEQADRKPDGDDDDPLAGLDDEDFASVAAVKRALARERKAIQTELQQAEQARQARRIAKSEDAARRKYANAGDGLDWDTVVGDGLRRLTPHDQAAIRNADDPADEAYRRITALVPEFRDRVAAAATRKATATQTPAADRTTRPAESRRRAPTDVTFEDLVQLSDDDLLARVTELEGAA